MDSPAIWQQLQADCAAFLSLRLMPHELQRCVALYNLLTEANQHVNLTRIQSEADFCTRHLLDSWTLVPQLKSLFPEEAFLLVDVGSGAGFPVLPLAILFPKAQFIAIESVQKKARFIESAVQALTLDNIQVIADRSEAVAHQPAYRAQCDVVVARAVSPLNILCELCLPLVKPNGVFIAMKTTQALSKELSQAEYALKILGGKVKAVHELHIPSLPNHVLISIQKLGYTLPQYPRQAGIPAKKPLLGP